MSSASQSSYHVAMSSSPSPPTNIGSYARIMHQHTKRQMEAASQSTRRRSSQGSNDSSTNQSASGPSALPNGLGRNRGSNHDDYRYQN